MSVETDISKVEHIVSDLVKINSDEHFQLNREVYAVKQDMAKINQLVERFDISISKLTEVSSNISTLLAVQSNRIEQTEKLTTSYSANLDKYKEQHTKDYLDLREKIDSLESTIKNEFQNIITHTKTDIKSDFNSFDSEMKTEMKNLSAKVSNLEKWMWTVCGGGFVIGFIVSSFDKIQKLLD